jgi:hypothetical protein
LGSNVTNDFLGFKTASFIFLFRSKFLRVILSISTKQENIGVIDNKTGDILAKIDDVKDVVIKHLNEVADKMKEKITSSKKNTVNWTGPRLSLIVLTPQQQYRWILQSRTSDEKVLRIKK